GHPGHHQYRYSRTLSRSSHCRNPQLWSSRCDPVHTHLCRLPRRRTYRNPTRGWRRRRTMRSQQQRPKQQQQRCTGVLGR
ncbi:hypothetical protein LTR33_016412, partial [Friedmanniomyces endolithicus]